jgi:hypothetical protein
MGLKDRVVNLTTHLHLMLRLEMYGATSTLLHTLLRMHRDKLVPNVQILLST